MSKESFKSFVKVHPELSKYVMNKNKSWQQFYELYDLYGEDNPVWDEYLTRTNNYNTMSKETENTSNGSISDLVKVIKNVDLKSVQKTVGNLQKTIGLLQDLGIGGAAGEAVSKTYEPRPMYRYFED